jgi:hypothetical protein
VFRHSLKSLLIFAYLAASMARGPHAHASQAADHDVRAHVHFDWIEKLVQSISGSTEKREPHAHHHDHHGHSHHHGHGNHEHEHSHQPTHDVVNEVPAPGHRGEPDHDSTCVYFADCPEIIVPQSTISDDSRVIAQVTILNEVAANVAISRLIRPEWAHAPPESLIAGSNLVLKLRTLRN